MSGKIVVGGSFLFIDNGTYYMGLIRLNSNGDLDRILKPLTNNETIYSITSQPDGKLIIGGGRRFTQSNYYGVVYRLNLDGSIDSTFKRTPTWGNPDYIPYVQTISYLENNKILVGGRFTKYDNKNANHVVLLNSDGTVDSTFVGNANGDVWTTQSLKEKQVLVGGGFNNYNGIARNRLTRISFSTPICYAPKSITQDTYPINSKMLEANMSIYPNPASITLTIDQLEAGGILTITDLSGRVVYSNNIVNSRIEINVARFANGIYLIKYITKGQHTHIKKFSVNN